MKKLLAMDQLGYGLGGVTVLSSFCREGGSAGAAGSESDEAAMKKLLAADGLESWGAAGGAEQSSTASFAAIAGVGQG